MKNTAETINTGSSARSFMSIRQLTVTAMLSAVSFVLMGLDFSVPLMPSFIKMDLSDFPALLAAFSFGPVSGVFVCLIKNLLHLMRTQTGGVGELANFMLGVCYVVPAGLIYKRSKTLRNAVIGALVGSVAMAAGSLLTNYFITYPVYYNFLPQEAVLGMYREILPTVPNIFMCLLIFNVPFTFVKALLCSAVVFPLYKPLSPVLKGKNIA